MNKALELDDLPKTAKDYLKGLTEAYNQAHGWDTRRQILSIMSSVTSFKAVSGFIPGLTRYLFTLANLQHCLQYACSMAECKASVRKSLQGLNYFAADGARAFEDLNNLVRQLGDLGLGNEWQVQHVELLKGAKSYIKGDLKVTLFTKCNIDFVKRS